MKVSGALLIGLALIAAAPVLAQQADALSGPAQPKISALPAPATAGPGRGGTPTPEPIKALGMADRLLELELTIWAAKWPSTQQAIVPSGVSALTGTLVTADGRQFVFTLKDGRGVFYFGGAITNISREDNVAYMLYPDPGGIQWRLAFSLADGTLIEVPPFVIAEARGTQRVALEGGGSLTVGLIGAHPLTADQLELADTLARQAANRPPPAMFHWDDPALEAALVSAGDTPAGRRGIINGYAAEHGSATISDADMARIQADVAAASAKAQAEAAARGQ